MKETTMSLPAGRFKAECLALLDRVARTGVPIVVTKRGRPVAKIVATTATDHGWLRGSVKERGDITGPTGVRWDADR